MILAHVEERIQSCSLKAPKCDLSGMNIADADLPSLIDHLKENPFVSSVLFHNNPGITEEGVFQLRQSLPHLKLSNFDCEKDMHRIMEQQTCTHKQTLPLQPILTRPISF